ncbi:MAG: AmmeMemoRadiSam system protein A [Betaproteobacteria bacterium]|nr:AmmeMemoRadiSam system protein A [Betaproteobacteria bacterium]MBI3937370.1 AmmeMemoRadiSam system protein A [Betaproteobacteria bacterium]
MLDNPTPFGPQQAAAGIAFPQDAGTVLLPLARAAIAQELGRIHPAREDAPWLKEPGACFVTLHHDEKLRGCVGSLAPQRALVEDVRANAVAAAFRDPRFTPLSAEEFDLIDVEVSLLSAIESLAFRDEEDALALLRPAVDGLILEYGYHRSTFLPQVWESLREPREFLASLKYKAGLPPDFWNAQVKLSRYTVTKWRESDLKRVP